MKALSPTIDTLMKPMPQKFIVACPVRSVCDHHARVFESLGRLEGHYLGTRNGAKGISDQYSKRFPLVGLISYVIAKANRDLGEAGKVACFPLFDRWVKQHLRDRTGILSSYGYTVESFRKARKHGGITMLDAGNSHPANFWEIVSEEHARWGSRVAPYPKKWNDWGKQSVELTDWIFSPSSYVTNSLIEKGFPADRVLHLPYPVDLSLFTPEPPIAVPASPLRVVCTGGVTLRKGFPYLLEAIRLIRKQQDVVLMLTHGIHKAIRPLMSHYSDIPIDWSPGLPHTLLGARLKSAHVFALLSVEEGMARTALEAMACGLPVVLTPNTGTSDYVVSGKNGEIVPIRDAEAAADAIVRCYERRISGHNFMDEGLQSSLSFETFATRLIGHLKTIDAGGPRAI